LTGGHIITVTGPTTFTFEATNFATYTNYPFTNASIASPANANATGVGGTILIRNRSQWRDAWLEQSILSILADAKKKKNDVPRPKRSHLKKKSQKARFSPHEARQMYGRDVVCPEGVHVTAANLMPKTKNITLDTTLEGPAREQETQRVISIVTKSIVSELKSGGLCLNNEGKLMATATCKELLGVKTKRSNVRTEEEGKKKHVGGKLTMTYKQCIATCGTPKTPEFTTCVDTKCSIYKPKV
jgi:hypothetical protein